MARNKIIELFLNNNEEEQVQCFIDEMLQKKTLKDGNRIESGGLGVRCEGVWEGEASFSIYRIIGFVTKKKLLNKKESHGKKQS